MHCKLTSLVVLLLASFQFSLSAFLMIQVQKKKLRLKK